MVITGCNFVRCTRHGLQACRKLWPGAADRFEVRRQALKLRWWDERHLHGSGCLFDLTYESVKSLQGQGIYELRLDDEIGGMANIRVVFFDPPRSWKPLVHEERPKPILWVLEAKPKRRNEWTTNDITRFRASRRLIQVRFYET
jgi:hypothetical protein